MKENHKLGLYVAYYLSRYSKTAYSSLGYGNMLKTHKEIGIILSVPANTIRNWRDEFDPLFGHRAGWYQRPMTQSRLQIVEALQDLDEISVHAIVTDILNGNTLRNIHETEQLSSIISENKTVFESNQFILRGPTGKSAEDFFIKSFNSNDTPFLGKLIDCRDYGCGYDFRVEGAETIYIEVKGLCGDSGGILFTNKEWQVANDKRNYYYLCIIKSLKSEPVLHFINNPAEKFNPKKNIHTVIQVNWSISEKQLNL